jgi:hypothetical protein
MLRSSNHSGNITKNEAHNKQKREDQQKITPLHNRVEFEKGAPPRRPTTTRSTYNASKDDYMNNKTSQRFTNRNAPPRRPPTTRYQNMFLGYYFSCHNFGHKSINCRANTRYNYLRSRDIYKTTRNDYISNKTTQEFADINYNPFSPLMNSNIECYKCNNFGHKAHECRRRLESMRQNMKEKYFTKHEEENTRVWKKKLDQQKGEENNLALHAQRNTSQWYIDSGCSKHMTGDQNIFLTLKKTKGGNVMFGNDNSTKIIGKGTISLGSKKAKEEDVLLIEDMKHNLLSVSQICDQGHTLVFYSQKCEIRSEKYGRMVATTLRTPNNIYILDEVKGEKCCMGKIDQRWLWHRRMGHINFDNLVKINKKKVVRDLPLIVKPSDPICKHFQHGKQDQSHLQNKGAFNFKAFATHSY